MTLTQHTETSRGRGFESLCLRQRFAGKAVNSPSGIFHLFPVFSPQSSLRKNVGPQPRAAQPAIFHLFPVFSPQSSLRKDVGLLPPGKTNRQFFSLMSSRVHL